MKKHYRLAEVEVTLEIPEELKYRDWEPLEAFRVESVRNPHIFRVELEDIPEPTGRCVFRSPKLLVFDQGNMQSRYIGDVEAGWQMAYVQTESFGRRHIVRISKHWSEYGISSKALLNALCIEHLVVEAGGCILHASCIAWKEKAILFTAPSGTGKSTQAGLWEKLRHAEIINGDRIVIRMEQGNAVACGLPFAGSSGICKNRVLPLAAIVCLSQAPETVIQQLNGVRAFRRIWEGCSVNTWDKQDLLTATDTVSGIIKNIPVFHLACTPDESAVAMLEQKLRGQEGI